MSSHLARVVEGRTCLPISSMTIILGRERTWPHNNISDARVQISLLYIIKHWFQMGHTRLDRDSNVVRHDSRLEGAWCRYNKSNSLRGKKRGGSKKHKMIIRALCSFLEGQGLRIWKVQKSTLWDNQTCLWMHTIKHMICNCQQLCSQWTARTSRHWHHLPLVKARFTLIDLTLNVQRVRWSHSTMYWYKQCDATIVLTVWEYAVCVIRTIIIITKCCPMGQWIWDRNYRSCDIMLHHRKMIFVLC